MTPSEELAESGGATSEHDLKVYPAFFEALVDGRKTFEFRLDDRGYAVGDELRLREWDPAAGDSVAVGAFTGRELRRRVSFVLGSDDLFGPPPFQGGHGQPNYRAVVLGLEPGLRWERFTTDELEALRVGIGTVSDLVDDLDLLGRIGRLDREIEEALDGR